MGNVIQFGKQDRLGVDDKVYEELSCDLSATYNLLGLPCSGAKVIANPSWEGYDPKLHRDGAMQLGRYGVEDFQTRFSDNQIDPLRFYVTVHTLRHGLNFLRATDTDFEDSLLKVARKAKDKKIFKEQGFGGIMTCLIGHVATDMALQREVTPLTKPNDKLDEKIRVGFAAEKIIKTVLPQHAIEERRRTLGYILLNSPETLSSTEKAVATMIRRRRKQSVII